MRSAGIREARQNFTSLLDEVRKGREVVITDRGRAVARLMPPRDGASEAFSGRKRFRATVRLRGRSLSSTVGLDRADRF